ncbi:hypothetical protein EA462_13865 [Natrarchaeobius halalkaliphilus]|uniref:Uncharacterized protein n=1 Tax=Natrarchaeobius halalkaliphilus TaxID=1679091 RepID=A0A3N6M089_9EURY|nr:hypothetical protein [Natrarchaeobius halalkaliphilus]RQG87944.1 hypothetical protein EA462_13865 [Natrarchaeobius halalkaliphilus]
MSIEQGSKVAFGTLGRTDRSDDHRRIGSSTSARDGTHDGPGRTGTTITIEESPAVIDTVRSGPSGGYRIN